MRGLGGDHDCLHISSAGIIHGRPSESKPERMRAQEASQKQQEWLKYSQSSYGEYFAQHFTLEVAWKNVDDSVLPVPQSQG